jgi:phenylalanyl-tRNA synthetase beta chain
MKLLLSWLSDYIETGLSAEQVGEVLSDLGFPCEGIEHLGDDAVIDIEVTSNRGDCLSYIGVAREIAAATGKELKMPMVALDESEKHVEDFASVEIVEASLCGRYTARIIDGVAVGSAPPWMTTRLEAVGLRSVNNVVDATNYAMMETGQPPHAFDHAKIQQGKIIVRKAVSGERIVSIDGTTCDLGADMLTIADPRGPVGIAGVMGGLNTEVGDTTTTVLLEDAYFDPVSIRSTSRKLGLPSEAAFRFERTVDIERVSWASKRTAQLIARVAGGKVAKGVVDVYPVIRETVQVSLRLLRLAKLLGIEVPKEQVLRILSGLSFKPRLEADRVICSVPSWRSDIHREVDLIEEVARVHGYNKIPTEQKIEIEVAPVDERQRLSESIGRFLNGCGFHETVTVGFVDHPVAQLFAGWDTERHLKVQEESRKDANLLRRTLLGSLLGVLETNLNAKNLPCRIYEIADTFIPSDDEGHLPTEEAKLALLSDSDLRDLRGVIEALIESIDRDAQIEFRPMRLSWAEVGAEIVVNEQTVGTAGVFSSAVGMHFDFEEITPVGAELDFEQLRLLQKGPVTLKPIPRFPAIQRDLSIIVDEQVRWSDVVAAIKDKAPPELEDISFVDVYRGKGIPSGRKSVTLSIRFRDEHGTLTHESVDGFQADIVDGLSKNVGAELRTM